MKKNVMYVIWALEIGGAEKMVVSLASHLNREIYNPIVCCLNYKGRLAYKLEEEGISVIELGKRPRFDLSIIPKFIKVMRNNNSDIVHTHLWTSDFWGRLAAKLAGVPTIISTVHNVDSWKPKMFLVVDRILSYFTDKIIAVSDTVKYFYINNAKISAGKIKTIYNGIEVEKFSIEVDKNNKRQELGLDPHNKIIAVIGRLVEQKGHIYFLEYCRKLLDKYSDIQGLIVGDGPLRRKLEERSKILGISNRVIFAGIRNDIAEILKVIDILVVPSLYEGLPTIILEAMAAGIPVVATDVGGNSELLINGETGFIVPSKDSSALADSIEKLLKSDALAKRMGSMGRRRAIVYFSLDKMVRETEELYEGLNRE